ncbi:hypothetical protein V494_06559 [Pseudogymnoascus sp. VKM F-4513 (FW-928)]|nr:hypothetical protein V494_06559 [Pseudogymnoascus sp. VKM F-4513 (FW-928)]
MSTPTQKLTTIRRSRPSYSFQPGILANAEWRPFTGLELDSLLFDLPLFPLEDVCCATDQDMGNGGSHYSCRHYIGTTEPNFSFWSSRPAVMREGVKNIMDILSGLPPQDTCDNMYQNFVETMHPLIPLLHLPTFDNLYRRFWDWRATWTIGASLHGVLTENPSFLPILLAVLFTGSISHPWLPNSHAALGDQKKLYEMIPVALSMVGFPHRPSLYSLMAFILLNSILIREEESLSSCSFVAVAFRVCQAMGIHKDGTDFGLDEIQTEERRRVWCHLMHLDVMTSILSGLPLIASSEMFSDTRMIQELRDEYIGKVQLTGDCDSSSIVDLNYVLTAGRYDSSSCMRNILLWQFSHTPVSLDSVKGMEKSIEELRVRTETRIKRLGLLSQEELSSPSYRSNSASQTPCDDTTEGSTPRALWGKDLLSLMVEKAYCLLYHPVMRHSNLWTELRARSLKVSESPRNTFALLGPEGRITNGTLKDSSWPNQRYSSAGAKQAWMRLEKLRLKVWQKLGLDHSVLWARTIGKTPRQSGSTGTSQAGSSVSQNFAHQPIPSGQNALVNINAGLPSELQNMPPIGFNTANFDNLDQQYLLEDQLSTESNLEGLESAWQTFGSEGGLSDTMPPFGNINFLG